MPACGVISKTGAAAPPTVLLWWALFLTSARRQHIRQGPELALWFDFEAYAATLFTVAEFSSIKGRTVEVSRRVKDQQTPRPVPLLFVKGV